MLRFHEVVDETEGADPRAWRATRPRDGVLTLTFDERRKSRLLATLDDGREAALLLPRGTVLRHGDHLRDDRGLLVEVRAAAESLSIAATRDTHLLTRAAYHLGNRHVPVEVGDGWLAYAHDHVLDDMVRGLRLEVTSRVAPFEPEVGAFAHDASGAHGHGASDGARGQGDGNTHGHAHDDDHADDGHGDGDGAHGPDHPHGA